MSEKELCWKCKEELLKEYPFGHPLYMAVHCHHSPKEKEKCWCDKVIDVKFKAGWNIYLEGHQLKISFCPACGRKL